MKHFTKFIFTAVLFLSEVIGSNAQFVTDPWSTMGGQARGIAVDAAGNVYTANGGNSTVSKITSSGTLTLAWATLASGTGPRYIAVDALGNVYTAANNTISKINSTGTVTQSWSFSGQPSGIVIDGSNNIYCSNYTNSTIMKISAAGTLSNPWVSLASGSTPMSIAIDASGNIYTPNYNNANGTVSKITPSGSLTQTYASITSAPGGYPTFIHVDRFGNLYGSTTNYTIYRITSAGTLTDPWATLTNTGGNTQKLVTDVLGNVYAVSNSTYLVSKITPSGTVTASWVTLASPPTGIGPRPMGIVIDSTGNLYLVNSNIAAASGNVTRIETYNTWLGATSSNWGTASNWSFAAVPTSDDIVQIPSGTPFSPSYTSFATTVNSLTINSGATLSNSGGSIMVTNALNNSGTIQFGTMNVGGALTNSGTISGNATINLNGSSVQTISGSGTISRLTLNNSSGATISSGLTKITGALVLISGTLNTEGNLTIAPGAAITGTYANVTGSVTLQQDLIAQRGYRIFANPFASALTSVSSAGQNTTVTTANDVKTWSQVTNSWSTAGSGYGSINVASNQPYAMFIRGAATDNISGATYTTGPSAFTYATSGTLNGESTAVTPANTSNILIVGNPYAAPVNTQALTGQTAAPYYTYQISVNGNGQTKQGSWVASSGNSDVTKTIPVLGVVAYQPASTTTFNITTSDINTFCTLQTGLFGVQTIPEQVELLVKQNGNYQDKLFVRLDAKATAAGTDKMELKKLYNDVVNVYTITPDDHRMAIDARNSVTNIPLGITAPTGEYQFKLASNSLPKGTTVYVKDKLLNTQTEIKVGETYSFSITADTATKGEHRFELITSAAKGTINNIDPISELFTAEILGNVTSNNCVTVKITGNKGPISIQAINLAGKKLSTTQVGAGIQRVQLGNISSGMFLLQFSDGKSVITKKLFKL